MTGLARDMVMESVRQRASTSSHALDWADDPYSFGLYVSALRALRVADAAGRDEAASWATVAFFISRDEIEEFVRAEITGREFLKSLDSEAFDIAARLDVRKRRNLVALTWPRPFEMPIESADELIARTPYQLYRHIQINLAALALRWSRCSAPLIHGKPIELGAALGVLGLRQGYSYALLRELLHGDGPVLAMDEVIDIAQVLRLSYGDAELRAGDLEIPSLSGAGPGWRMDAAGLTRDLVLEGRLRDFRDRLFQEVSTQRPEEIHRLRIAPFGHPPKAGSRYRALFDYFDQQTRLRFKMSIGELETAFAGGSRRQLPRTAKHQRGWWSNPRPGKDGRPAGIGTQRQRAAWLTAGYEATNVQVQPNPRATTNADKLNVEGVTFRAVPGRELWHPFRDAIRQGGPTPLDSRQGFLESFASDDWTVLEWYDTVLMRVAGLKALLS